MLHRLSLTFCCIFYVLVLSPHLYSALSQKQTNALGGVESTSEPLTLSFPAFWEGRLATELDTWFSRKLGFREELIRTDNQINFSVFREISAQTSSPIVLGKHNTLFEKSYIDAFNNRNRVPDSQLEALAQELFALQQLLQQRGITLLLLVSPSKAVFHHTEIPDRLLAPNRGAFPRNMDVLRGFLTKAGVTVLDTPQFFRRQLQSSHPLFAKGGTHWSYFGACLVTARMMELLEQSSGKRLRQIDCSKVGLSDKPRLTDKDLAELANLWSIEPFFEQLGYPGAVKSARENEHRPRVMFVGSSFLWTILHYVKKFRITDDYKMLYYYRTVYRQRGGKYSLERGALDWSGLIRGIDAIVIEINEAAIEGAGYGFIQDAINYLRSLPTEQAASSIGNS